MRALFLSFHLLIPGASGVAFPVEDKRYSSYEGNEYVSIQGCSAGGGKGKEANRIEKIGYEIA